MWASPPLEDCSLADLYFCSAAVVEFDVVAIVHGHIPGVGELAGAEERRATQVRDHVDGACWVTERLLEKVDF